MSATECIMRTSDCFKGFYREHCIYLPPMAGWFVFSALLSSYNKIVFGSGQMGFPCPLLLTSIHFLIQWVFSWSLTTMFPETLGGDRVKQMSWRQFLSISVPCGLITSGDVGMSNLSLVRISITFYTMVKASTPVFVMAWAYVFGIERITFPLILVVAVIASGEFLTVMGETEFDVIGFVLCLSASCLSGARWTLVQLKLQTLDPPLKTTVATMRVLSPSMFFSMLLISIVVEQPWKIVGQGYLDDPAEFFHTLGLGLLGAVFAIAMILCEFSLIMKASAVILMIGGVVKEMITIFVGVKVFHDPLNRVNEGGCIIVFLGVVLYKVQFHLMKKAKLPPSDEVPTMLKSQSALQYRSVKDHFSDDEGDLRLGVDDFLDEEDEDKILAELEMQGSHRRLSSLNSSTHGSADSDSSSLQSQRQNLVV